MIVAKSEDSWEKSLNAAEKMTPEVQRDFLAWAAALGKVSEADLARAIETGDIGVVIASIWSDEQDKDLDKALTETLTKMTDKAGMSQWASLDLVGSFDLKNPYSEAWIPGHVGQLVVEVSNETKAMVADVVLEGFQDGKTPQEMAKAIRAFVGLRTDQVVSIANKARAMQEAGIKGKKLEARIATETKRQLKARSVLIARTETIETHAQGALAAWKDARDKKLLPAGMVKVWVATPGSERTCPVCMSLHDKVIDLDGQFSAVYQMTPLSAPKGITRSAPTAHPACRCAMRLVYQGKALGKSGVVIPMILDAAGRYVPQMIASAIAKGAILVR